ncbi:MAG: arginine repressor [Syntrophothermus sp.]
MKSARQAAIMALIAEQAIETQEDLVEALRKKGMDVTQATVSRDIKELGLIKVPSGGGGYKYALPATQQVPGDVLKRARRLFQDSVVGMDFTQNLIVIKTHPGAANNVADAVDDLPWPEIMGTLAGDDTILVVVKGEGTESVLERFRELRG